MQIWLKLCCIQMTVNINKMNELKNGLKQIIQKQLSINLHIFYYQIRGMNKQSINSFNKISIQMDRLSNLIHKEDIFSQQLQSALDKNRKSDSSSSADNLDLYFKQYENPTTKSIPFLSGQESQQQNSETINTIHKNINFQGFEQWNRQNIQDDKNTLILGNMKNDNKQQEYTMVGVKSQMGHYTSVNNNNRNCKKDSSLNKSKQNSTKNATSSIPSQISASLDQNKQNIVNNKNFSLSKAPIKQQFIIANLTKNNKKVGYPPDQETDSLIKQLKGKFAKISKIDRDELNRLQQKKISKKTEQSSNRKKTKRDSINAKSSITMSHPEKISQGKSNFKSNITLNNASSKLLDGKKKQIILKKNDDKIASNEQSWQKTLQKGSKKLNRINISKLQQNMKKAQDKKIAFKDISRKDKKIQNKKQAQKAQELKLHFTEQDEESAMKKIINEKQLTRQYARETEKYNQMTKKISKVYFEVLIKEFRQSSKEAILKGKLVTLMLCFFDQFTTTPLLSNSNKFIKSQFNQFFQNIAEEQLIQVLLHPKKIINLMEMLPNRLMNENIIGVERKELFDQKFIEINNQLDHQLQLFLIKKTPLYMYMHSLSEYINFLLQKQLIEYTKRSKLVIAESEQKMHGFYSSRGKKDIKKYVKRNEGPYKFGFRCDSDRKITIEDEDIYFKNAKNMAHSPSIKQTLSRKVIK